MPGDQDTPENSRPDQPEPRQETEAAEPLPPLDLDLSAASDDSDLDTSPPTTPPNTPVSQGEPEDEGPLPDRIPLPENRFKRYDGNKRKLVYTEKQTPWLWQLYFHNSQFDPSTETSDYIEDCFNFDPDVLAPSMPRCRAYPQAEKNRAMKEFYDQLDARHIPTGDLEKFDKMPTLYHFIRHSYLPFLVELKQQYQHITHYAKARHYIRLHKNGMEDYIFQKGHVVDARGHIHPDGADSILGSYAITNSPPLSSRR